MSLRYDSTHAILEAFNAEEPSFLKSIDAMSVFRRCLQAFH